MHYNKAVQILANQAKRDDQQIIQAAKAILTVGDAEEPHATINLLYMSGGPKILYDSIFMKRGS